MRSTRAELVAMDIYQRAETAGQVITLDMCEQRITELRGHRPTCRCGHCGERSARAKPANVFEVASRWQRWAARPRAQPAWSVAVDPGEPRSCARCGAVLTAKRRDARCCSAACRVAASRARRRG